MFILLKFLIVSLDYFLVMREFIPKKIVLKRVYKWDADVKYNLVLTCLHGEFI